MTRWRHFSCVRLCAVLTALLLTLAAAPAAAQAVSLTGSDATVQPGSSSPVRINQAFGSSNWGATGSAGGTTYTGNSVQIPGVSPARWFCFIRVDSTRAWSVRTRTADFAAVNCPTNGLGTVSTTGLVAVIVEDGPPPSVVAQFALNSSYWTTTNGYLRSGTQSALTAGDLTNINARTAERVLLVHTGASGGTLCITGSETGCGTALTWIPSAAAATSMTAPQVQDNSFTVQWSGAWTGTVDNTVYLFAKAVASGLTVDVSSGAESGGGGSHVFSGLTANTRYVVTVCSRSGTGGVGELCYDASADAGIQGVEVMTVLPPPIAPTSVTVSGATPSSFNVAWSGGRSSIAGGYQLFAKAVASGLTVDVTSGATPVTGGTHAVTGLNAGTRYVVTVCSQTGGTLCYDASADTGVQGVEVTTLAAPDGELEPELADAPDAIVLELETACSTVPAEAPEGGTATAVVELASAVAGSTTVRWHLARDADPATADADAGDHGGASGEVQVRAGVRCAEIEIDILDDEDAEPAREWFEVVLRASAQLARTTIPVAVMEGVCDRTPVVRDALLDATDAASCEAPASADLHRVSELTLAEAGLDTLAAEDFSDLTGLRTLDLAGNGLTELPALPALVRLERLLLRDNALEAAPLAALPAPESLRELILSNNALSELPENALAAVPGLRSLRLDGNRLNTLPAGLFEGSSSLRLQRLDGNPGAPFMVRVNLERVDAEPWAQPPAMLRAVVPLGAPFETVAALAAEGATFANGSGASETTVEGGETAGMPLAVDSTGGFARVALTVPMLPDRQCLSGPCWQGFALEAGPPLTLFARRVLGDEPVPLFGEDLRVSLSLLAEAGELSGDLEWSVYSSDPSLAGVHIAGGHLLVEPGLGAEGDLRVEATATDANGQTTTVYFDVRVEFHWPTRSWREIPIMDGQR